MDAQCALPREKRPRLSTENSRSSKACNACRERKIKCCGSQPCTYCTKRRRSCVFPELLRKKLYPIEYVQALEDKVASLDGQEATTPQASPSVMGAVTSLEADGSVGLDLGKSPWDAAQHSPLDPQAPVVGSIAPEFRLYDTEDDGDASTIVPGSVSSSSLQFGNQIKSLGVRSPISNRGQTRDTSNSTLDSDDVYGIEASISNPISSALEWPSPDQARPLVDTVLRSVGRLQQLFEPRGFSDRLCMAYEKGSPHHDANDLWYIELLMVLALGELLQGQLKDDQVFPGMKYYVEAERHLPSLVTLRKKGILAVEIMSMMAFYLQCADRRDDAYVYAGMGLRLAISNGLAHEGTGSGMMSSESSHRVRLWWTIYMQERRLAAATGHPLSIHDEDITTTLPAEFPGFFPPHALNVNIKLARITGRTMDAVYGHKNRSVSQYARCVKKIIGDLMAVANEIPSEFALDLSRRPTLTRAAATLYLMLYQCIILATRPTLLHLAQLRVTAGPAKPSASDITLLEKLAATCIEAATRSLEILKAMIDQRLIAKFGFFDLDATFSSAFVFVLVETIYPDAGKGCGKGGIRDASGVLQHLASCGNRAAAKRRMDIEQTCDQLGISFRDSSTTQAGNAEHAHLDDSRTMPNGSSGISTHANNGFVPTAQEPQICQPGAVESPEFDWAEATAAFFDQPFYGRPYQTVPVPMMDATAFGEGFSDQVGLYFDEFALTGVVETDWEELSRKFTS